ncbi:MAG: hypothetical protein IPM21_16945 [Acidobacteria bacterium]|nr:hypothetical protein [Acidobacteriota bacterium]
MNKPPSIKNSIRSVLLIWGAFTFACGSSTLDDPTAIAMMYGGSQLYPSYEVTFRANGTAEFISVVGPRDRTTLPEDIAERQHSKYTGMIAPDQLLRLKEVLLENGFSGMSTEYSPSTGGDLTRIRVEFGNEAKEVPSQHGSQGPKFDLIRKAIESVIDQIEWTKTPI